MKFTRSRRLGAFDSKAFDFAMMINIKLIYKYIHPCMNVQELELEFHKAGNFKLHRSESAKFRNYTFGYYTRVHLSNKTRESKIGGFAPHSKCRRAALMDEARFRMVKCGKAFCNALPHCLVSGGYFTFLSIYFILKTRLIQEIIGITKFTRLQS